LGDGAGFPSAVFRSFNFGDHVLAVIGSSIDSFPSSLIISTASRVIGLVIERSQKSESSRRRPLSTSGLPDGVDLHDPLPRRDGRHRAGDFGPLDKFLHRRRNRASFAGSKFGVARPRREKERTGIRRHADDLAREVIG